MLSSSIIKISCLILNLCSNRSDGSFNVSGIAAKYDGKFDFHPNDTDFGKHSYNKLTLSRLSGENTIKGFTGLTNAQMRKNNANLTKLESVITSFMSKQFAYQITRYYERYKLDHKFSSNTEINKSEHKESAAFKDSYTSPFKKSSFILENTDVDRRYTELILVNATRLPAQSHNFLDELQTIKPNQQKPRKKITAHLSGIKGFSEKANSFGESGTSSQSTVYALVRKKRNEKFRDKETYNYDEIEINSLTDVYEYLHKVLDALKHSVNFTMRSSDPNITSDAEKMCMQTLHAFYAQTNDDGQLYCNSSWDNFSCWPRTLAGTSASIPCPGYLDGINDKNNATKYCNENGKWAEKAVYDLCVMEDETTMDAEIPHVMPVRVIYNVGFCISTLALIIALFIFLYFRSLRCLRNSIHCHLIVTFILKNIVWVIMRHTLIYMQDSAYSWCCKTLTSIFNFAQATNFFWMFVEGLYLHIIIVWTYSADKIKLRYLLFIGWGLPSINILAWIIVRAIHENDHCWFPHPEGNSIYDFVYIGPILFVLFANIIFLSTIVWVLITKLRASHSLETRQYRKAVKATIILFPLLGITYVLFIIPPSNHPQVKIVFKYINAVLQSFQGLMVAIFYCFLNGEVKGVLKKKISRFNDARSLSTKYTRTSYGWSRGSRDYTNTVPLGNGSLIDPNHRVQNTVKENNTETIPLTDSNTADTKQSEFM